jgi:hypothetical protein
MERLTNVNTFTNISKTNSHLSSQVIEHANKKKQPTTYMYDFGSPVPGLGYSQNVA